MTLELSSGIVSEETLSVALRSSAYFRIEIKFEVACRILFTLAYMYKTTLILCTFLHSTESNQYSASNFYSTPTSQSVYSYSAPATQPSRESSEPAKPVYLSGGRAPLATHQTGNHIYFTIQILTLLLRLQF